MWALGIGMGVTCIGLSLRYRTPVVTAWSTPGAALIATSAAGLPMSAAIGAFLVSGALMVLFGVTRWFERGMSRIPVPLASGMLAGVLLRFGLDAFVAMKTQLGLALAMFAAYLLGRRFWPRYAIVVVLALGTAIAGALGLLNLQGVRLELARPIFTAPTFTLGAVVGLAIPLFVVTMASQNVPGVAVMRASGYGETPISPLVTWTGLTTLLLAPFGGYAFNLAAITAALCMGREAHEDPARRYVAAAAAGAFYLVLGLFGATVGALFAAFPRELVMAIAGLALIGTIASGLRAALHDDRSASRRSSPSWSPPRASRCWASGSAFWGLVAGLLAMFVLQRGSPLAAVAPVGAPGGAPGPGGPGSSPGSEARGPPR